MTKLNSHSINSRTLTTFKNFTEELTLHKHKNYLFDLDYLGVMDLRGEKTLEFLQGQLTADLRMVSDIHMMQSAQCNLKGRILSLLDVISWDGIKIILPKDLIADTQSSLAKTAMLSRVAVTENNRCKVLGFYLQNQDDVLPYSIFLPDNVYAQTYSSSYCYYHLGEGFYIFIVKTDIIEEFCSLFVDVKQYLGSLTWHSLRLAKKQLDIYPESRGLFLPHRLDLHQTPLLSFDKGCYKGQEIIARTHYRATLKHELKLYKIITEQKIYSGQKLYRINEDTEVGELVDYSILDHNTYLIAISSLKQNDDLIRFEGNNDTIKLIAMSRLT